MCSELCKDFYVVYQLEMVAGEVESSCQLIVTFFFYLTLPNLEISLGQLSGAPLISTTSSAAAHMVRIAVPYAYGCTVRVWYVPYAYGTKYAHGIEHYYTHGVARRFLGRTTHYRVS